MKIVNKYVNYLNIVLTIILVIVLIVFLIKLIKMLKIVSQTSKKTNVLTDKLQLSQSKIDTIKDTSDSWTFLMSTYVVGAILKETFKDRKSKNTFSKSLGKSIIRHSNQISKIRF